MLKSSSSLSLTGSCELHPSLKPTQKRAFCSNSQVRRNCFSVSAKHWSWEISLSQLSFCLACSILLSCIMEQEAFKICKFPDEFLSRGWSLTLSTFQNQRMSKERKQIKTLLLTLLSIKAASVRPTHAWCIFKEGRHEGAILQGAAEEYQGNGKHWLSALKPLWC